MRDTPIGTRMKNRDLSTLLVLCIAGAMVIPAVTSMADITVVSVTEIPTLGGNSSGAWGVNNLGQVTGEADPESGSTHAFLWDATSGLIDLGGALPEFSGQINTRGLAINDSGQITGVAFHADGPDRDRLFYWEPSFGPGGMVSGIGGSTTLDSNSASKVSGNAISNNGKIGGAAELASLDGADRSFIITPMDTPENATVLFPPDSALFDMNNANDATGRGGQSESGPAHHAFLWLAGAASPVDLGTLGGSGAFDFSSGMGVNIGKDVVGQSGTADGNWEAFFVPFGGSMVSILPDTFDSKGRAISNNRMVVGTDESDRDPAAGTHSVAFLYDANSGLMIASDLDTLLPEDSGWSFYDAKDISPNGRFIVGTGNLDGNERGWRLEIMPPLIPGDANGDGMVDVADLGVVGANFNQIDTTFNQGNFNDDDITDVADLGILGANWTAAQGLSFTQNLHAVGAMMVVPEPTTTAIFIFGLACLGRRH